MRKYRIPNKPYKRFPRPERHMNTNESPTLTAILKTTSHYRRRITQKTITVPPGTLKNNDQTSPENPRYYPCHLRFDGHHHGSHDPHGDYNRGNSARPGHCPADSDGRDNPARFGYHRNFTCCLWRDDIDCRHTWSHRRHRFAFWPQVGRDPAQNRRGNQFSPVSTWDSTRILHLSHDPRFIHRTYHPLTAFYIFTHYLALISHDRLSRTTGRR